jgi:hypothetical protein
MRGSGWAASRSRAGLGGEVPPALAAQPFEVGEFLEGRQKLGVIHARHELAVGDQFIGHGDADILPEAAEFHDERETAPDRMGYGHAVNGSGGSGERLAGLAELLAGEPALGKQTEAKGQPSRVTKQIAILAAPEMEVIDPADAAAETRRRFIKSPV